MTPPRLAVAAAASALALVACGPAETVPTTSSSFAPSTTTRVTTTTAPAPATTPTTQPSTTTLPSTTTTSVPPGPLVLLDTQPIIRGNLYTNPGAVVIVDGTWHMFRNQFSAWPGKSTTYHLVSSDGLEWEDRGPVFDSDAVRFTDGNAFVMDVIAGDDEWVGWFYTYEGSTAPGHIGRVTAPGPDGPWVADPDPVLSPGPEGAWDAMRVVEPTVVVDGDRYVMYYAGIGADRTSAIGLATSQDGISWTKYDDPETDDARLAASDPVLEGDTDSWNVGSVGCPDVERFAGGYMMIFDSAAAKGYARAVSVDGIAWQLVDDDSLIRQDTAPNRQPFWQSELVANGDGFRWYLEVGLGTGPTNIFAFDLEAPPTPPRLEASVSVEGDVVTIVVDAGEVDLRFVRDDTSGATAHPHAYVDRDPPGVGEFVPLGRDDVVHAVGDTIVLALPPGDHVVWVVLADGVDQVVIPPPPLRVEVTIRG